MKLNETKLWKWLATPSWLGLERHVWWDLIAAGIILAFALRGCK